MHQLRPVSVKTRTQGYISQKIDYVYHINFIFQAFEMWFTTASDPARKWLEDRQLAYL